MSEDPAGEHLAAPQARRRRLPAFLRQLGPVAAGLAVLGLGSFAFLSLTGRSLGPAEFAPVATLWVLFNSSALAFYQPLEQELGRATAHRRALGTGSRPVLLRCVTVGAAVTVALGLLALIARRPLSNQAFGGHGSLLVLLFVGLVGVFAQHTVRGLLAGNERFARYGAQLACDGLLRVLLPGAVALSAWAGATQLSAALVVAPLAAAILTAGRIRPLALPGPPAGWSDVLPALGTLIAAAVFSQLIINAAPLAAQLLALPSERDRAGVLIAAVVMTRIPLFFFGAVQAAFLPSLARVSALGDRAGLVRQIRTVVALVGGGGATFVLGLALLGPWALRLLYGAEFVEGRGTMVLLGFGAAAYMLAQALAQALTALRKYRASLLGWALGSAAFFGLLAAPMGLETRIATALLAGGAVAALTMVLLLVTALRRVPDSLPQPARPPAVGTPAA
jgi:O-antigen/teichoic acid export membrane protein